MLDNYYFEGQPVFEYRIKMLQGLLFFAINFLVKNRARGQS